MTSQARIEANKRNSQKSCGPKTPEGKERSRANARQHGMAGGVVIAEEDRDEVDARREALLIDYAPKSAVGRMMVDQLAALSVRMERAAKRELVAVKEKQRHAAEEFDERRIEEAERLFAGLGDDPRSHRRKLLRTPEGVDRMILAWRDLKDDLARDGEPSWTDAHLATACHLSGRKPEHAHVLRIGKLSKALLGDPAAGLDPEALDLPPEDRKVWVALQMVEQVDAEIADLEEHRETLDFEVIALDRAEAGERAKVDFSREANLARRYESEARRAFYKALDELHRAEAELAERPEPAPPQPAPPLGSFRESPVPPIPPSGRASGQRSAFGGQPENAGEVKARSVTMPPEYPQAARPPLASLPG